MAISLRRLWKLPGPSRDVRAELLPEPGVGGAGGGGAPDMAVGIMPFIPGGGGGGGGEGEEVCPKMKSPQV